MGLIKSGRYGGLARGKNFATRGMTLSNEFTSVGTIGDTVAQATDLSFRIRGVVAPVHTGIILTAGATGFGLILYAWNGLLIFRAGNGTGNSEANIDSLHMQWAMTGNQVRDIEVSASTTTGKGSLYIDRKEVSSDTVTADKLCGGVFGGFGRGDPGSVVPANLGGYDTDDAYSAALQYLRTHLNQLSQEVS